MTKTSTLETTETTSVVWTRPAPRPYPLTRTAQSESTEAAACTASPSDGTAANLDAAAGIAAPQAIACDARSSDLLNFPFAFGVFVTLMLGALAAGTGMVVDSVGLAASGFLLTLTGAGLYGWSLYDDQP